MLCAQDTSSTRFFPLSHWWGAGGGRGGRLGLLLSPPGPFHSEGPPACSVPGPEEGAQPALGFLLGNVLKMVRGRGAQLQGPFCYLKKLP